MIGTQLALLCAALGYYTRIPCPARPGTAGDDLERSTRYLPLVGILVGAWTALVYIVALMLVPAAPAVVLSMAAGVWLTGALHEDGLADTCDGFGGGRDRDRVLAIMKDSRAGSFAVIGLSLVLLLKFAVLTALPPALVPAALIAGHAVSRLAAVSVIPALDYVRGPDDARAGHVARGLSGADIVLASAAGLAPMALLADPIYLAALVPAAAVRLGLARHFRVRLGGYTGDCLGAVQQLTEVVFLLSILALWTSTSSVIPAST